MKSLIALVILMSFYSCRTVKKTTDFVKEKTDSVSVKKHDASIVSKKDSTNTINSKGNYEIKTIYQYDTLIIHDTLTGKDRIKYIPRIIERTVTGTYDINKTASKTSYDSAGLKTSDSTGKHQQLEQKKTAKETKSVFNFWWIIIIALILLAVAYFLNSKFKLL